MIYSSDVERELLELLSAAEGPEGQFFARLDEVKRKNFASEYLDRLLQCPDLSSSREFHLDEMCKSGLVEYLSNRSHAEGRQFRLTRAGSERLRSLRQGPVSKFADEFVEEVRGQAPKSIASWVLWVAGIVLLAALHFAFKIFGFF